MTFICFYMLQAEWRRQKADTFTVLNAGRISRFTDYTPLNFDHLVPCFRPAIEMGFTRERNLKGWRIEGLIPFNRSCLWKKRQQDGAQARLTSTRLSHTALPCSAGPPANDAVASATEDMAGNSEAAPARTLTPTSVEATAATTAADTGNAQPTPARTATTATAAAAATVAARLPAATQDVVAATTAAATRPASHHVGSLGPLPVAVQQAIKTLDASNATSGDIDLVHAVQKNLTMHQAWDVVSTFLRQKSAPPEPKRIKLSAADMWGKPGSATGEQVLVMHETRAAEKAAEEAEKDARARDREFKRKSAVATAVVLGAQVLQDIARDGPAIIPRLKNDQLLGLLQNAEPQVTVAKGTKAELIETVNKLSTVARAISQHTAAAAIPAAAAAIPPPQTAPSYPVQDFRSPLRSSVQSNECGSGTPDCAGIPADPTMNRSE